MKRLGMDEFIIAEKWNVNFKGVEVGLELINKDVPLLMFDFLSHNQYSSSLNVHIESDIIEFYFRNR